MFFKTAAPPVWPKRLRPRAAQPATTQGLGAGYRPGTGMRTPGDGATSGLASTFLQSVAAATAPPLPPLGAVVWNHAAFGPRPADVAAFDALGTTPAARLQNWVDRQLQPGTIADAACDARIAASSYSTLGKSVTQLWQQHFLDDTIAWEERLQPASESELQHWTRAVYGERQLLESMVHFWHNHFNVYAFDYIEGPMFAALDRDAVRANALGNFRTLVEAVARSHSMLVYLDNYLNFAENQVGYSNENFARESMELHMLGATVSYGKTPRSQVPLDASGRPLGYCEDDVKDMARALTGWTFDLDWISWEWGGGNSGQFVFVDSLHSTEAKTLLGVAMPAGRSALQDGRQAFDILCSHPACGTHIARKLLRRFVCDFPDVTCPALLTSAAALFTSLWQDPQQIQKVLRHILLSTEFQTVWGEKVKRPFELAVSAMRAGQMSFRFFQQVPYPPDWNAFDPDFKDTLDLHWMFDPAGQEIFAWHPPNGHPDVRGAWQSANPRVTLWRLANWLIDLENGAGGWRLDALGQTGTTPRSATELVDFWIPRVFSKPIAAATRQEFIDFMAQGFNPGFALPLGANDWPYYWQDRVRALVGLMFMSPEFLWR